MPELIENQDPKNSAIANRLQDDQETDNRPLGDVVIGEYQMQEQSDPATKTVGDILPGTAEKVKQVREEAIQVATQIALQQVADKKTRAKKATVVKPQGKVDVASAIEKLQEGIEKARKQMELIQLIDGSINPIAISAELPKGPRDLLLDYTKEIEAVKGKYIVAIQSL